MTPKKQMTLCIVHQGDQVLLGMKKKGFGAGRWNGFGGKVEPGETIEAAARREIKEEAGIEVKDLEAAGVIDFEFQGKPGILEVNIFRSTGFSGAPAESDEMKPQWFSVDAIPFKEMWPDDIHWFPLFLTGKKFSGRFLFGEGDSILEQELKSSDSAIKKRVAVLTGGTSSERAIALQSADAVKHALGGRFEVLFYDLPNDLDKFLSDRRSIDVAVPVFHGRGGEDGVIQSFLRTLDIPYIFSEVEAHALAANKSIAKMLVAKQGVATPSAVLLSKDDKIDYKNPVVVKPIDGGSSIGVSVVKNHDDLNRALATAFDQSTKALVEDYVAGDEYTVAVVETKGQASALPVIAIKPKSGFFDLKSKYDPALSDEICPAPISRRLASALQAAALKAHQAIGARHISRSDFIVDKNGRAWFLEINTIPGMTVNSLVPKALKVAGLDFGGLLASWIDNL